MPAFSVIVGTYDRPELLREALGSIEAQTCDDFECLVIDDGSHTAAAVMPTDPRFHLIELEANVGATEVRNIGIAAATGDALAFLDDDDLWLPHRLALAATGLAVAPIAICGSRFMEATKMKRFPVLEGDVHHQIVDQFTPGLGRTAIERQAFLPFDPRFAACEDVDWGLRETVEHRVWSTKEVAQLTRRHDGARHGNGAPARIVGSELLLEVHAAYYGSHPKARAFRQYRLGVLNLSCGHRTEGRTWLRRSLRSRPSLRAGRRLAESLAGR